MRPAAARRCSRRWRRRTPSAAIRPRPAAPPCATAAATWLARRFGVELAPSSVAVSVGSKELVASVPHVLRCAGPSATPCCTRRCPTRPTPWGRSSPGAVPFPSPRRPAERAVSTWPRSTRTTRRAPSCCGPTRRRTRPAASATSVPRPSGGGPTASRSSPTSATPSSRGPARRARCSSTGTRAWSPCTRCRSAPTWPGCASASTPGTPSSSTSCAPYASTPGSWSPDRSRRLPWPPWRTTTTWWQQRVRYRERLEYLAAALVEYGCPCELPEGGFYLWVPVPRGVGLERRLGHGRGSGRRRRHPGRARRPLRRARAPGHVRVAVVQPMERLELVGRRLGRARERSVG